MTAATVSRALAKSKRRDSGAAEALIAKLAPDINSHYWDCINASKEAVSHAVAAGQELAQIKEALPHGKWLGFVEQHLEFSADTAQNFMKIADKLPAAIKKAGVEAHEVVSIRGALKLISQNNGKPKTQKPSVLGISDEPELVEEPVCVHEYDDSGVCVNCQKDFVPKVTDKDKPALKKDIDQAISSFKVLGRGVDALARWADQKGWGKVIKAKLEEIHDQFQVLRKTCK